jgi:GNAT superfamily N-acetyltransferase
MTEIRVRPADPEDGDAVARVFVASRATLTFLPKLHTDEEEAAYIRDTVLPTHEVLVAERDGVVAGFVAMLDNRVEHLYVDPGSVRRGVGSALLEQAKERMSEGFRLWVFVRNEGARRFYEQRGLELVEETDGSDNMEHEPDARYEWRPDR